MIVKRHLGDAGLGQNRVDAGRVKAPAAEKLQRRVDQAVAR
jgi:hypothetical protein